MITANDIVLAGKRPKKLTEFKDVLEAEQTKFNQVMEDFLANADLDPKNNMTVDWQVYRNLIDIMDDNDSLIRSTNYYLENNNEED